MKTFKVKKLEKNKCHKVYSEVVSNPVQDLTITNELGRCQTDPTVAKHYYRCDTAVGGNLSTLKMDGVAIGGYFALQWKTVLHWYIYIYTHHNLTDAYIVLCFNREKRTQRRQVREAT